MAAVTCLRRGFLCIFPLLLLSCEKDPIFIYPESGKEVDPTIANVKVNCIFKGGDIPLYKEIAVTKSSQHQELPLRTVYEIRRESGEIVERNSTVSTGSSFSDYTISTSLSPGKYSAYLWQDFLDEQGHEHYDVSSLSGITIRSIADYVGCTETKDALCSITDIEVPDNGEWGQNVSIEVPMERPVAKISFYSDDCTLFIEKCLQYLKMYTKADPVLQDIQDQISLKFSYDGYIVTKYSLLTSEGKNSALGYGFKGTLVETDDPSTIFIGSDYILLDTEESFVSVKLSVFDPSGELIEKTSSISIPVKRGHETIVHGDILTKYWGKGISIDPEFGGEFDYIVD